MNTRFLKAMLGRRPDTQGAAGPSEDALYAIGDIHGRDDLLEPLLTVIRQDCEARRKPILLCLGDYVDRGRDSRRVVELLLVQTEDPRIETRFLRGNHDQLLLDFLNDATVGPYWSRVGGRETLFSYGVEPPGTRKDMDEWQAARDAFAANLPARHLRFFQGLELSFAWGDYFFAHAGALPGTPLDAQSDRDLMWIRGPFLEDETSFEKVVVHGHTPAEKAYADKRRIGLDTGAYMTGVLTACRFTGSERRIFQAAEVSGRAPEIRESDL